MKRYLLIIILFFVVLNVQAISRGEYVLDNADILSVDTENYILEYSNYLKDELNIDYAVITTKEEYDNFDNYTDYLYDRYHISDKGILMVIDKNNRTINIHVGSKLSKIIPDSIIDKYIKKYMIGYYKNDLWDDGTSNGYTAFYKLLCNYYGIDSEILEVYEGDNFLNKYRSAIITIIMTICIALGYSLMRYFRYRFLSKRKDKISNILHDIIFYSSIFINVLLFILAYYFGIEIFLAIFAIEMISIISSYLNNDNKSVRRKKRGKVHSNR